jgi:hypothetical protein
MSSMERIWRGIVSLFFGLLLGTFVSAFVSMIATSVGIVISNEWLGVVFVFVTAGSVYPFYRLFWKRGTARLVTGSSAETVARFPEPENESWE